ncbi:hypothetical protein D3C84_955280 [compost metagenome]
MRLLELRLQAVDLRLEGPWIELKQQVPFLDERAVLKQDSVDMAGDSWAQLDRFGRFQSASELVPVIERLDDHLRDADCRGWMDCGGAFLGLAASDQHAGGHEG